jgi:hypothetical protein
MCYFTKQDVMNHVHRAIRSEMKNGKTPVIYFHQDSNNVCCIDSLKEFIECTEQLVSQGAKKLNYKNMGSPHREYKYNGKTYRVKWYVYGHKNAMTDPFLLMFGGALLNGYAYFQLIEKTE